MSNMDKIENLAQQFIDDCKSIDEKAVIVLGVVNSNGLCAQAYRNNNISRIMLASYIARSITEQDGENAFKGLKDLMRGEEKEVIDFIRVANDMTENDIIEHRSKENNNG